MFLNNTVSSRFILAGILSFVIFLQANNSFAQHNNLELPLSVNSTGDAPDSSAILDIQSSDKGILIPRLTAADRMSIDSPADGLLVYDTDSMAFFYFDGSDWTGIITDAVDSDADPTNELQIMNLSFDILSLSQGGGAFDLGPYMDNTDAQTLSFTTPNLAITGGNSVDLSSLTEDENWEATTGNAITNTNIGNVGIGNLAATQNRWQLTVKDTVNAMLGTDSIDVSELFAVFTRNLNENNSGIGIGFQSTSTVTGMGAAIVHERTSSNSRGKLHFATKASGSAADEDLPINMTIDETGDLGIGITSPTERLHVSGGDVLFDRGSSTASLSRSLTLGGARTGNSNFGNIDFMNYDNDSGQSNYVGARISSANGGDAADRGNLLFFTKGTSLSEVMRLTVDGKMGLGEQSPQATLDVVDQAVIGDIALGSESTDQGTSNAAGDGFLTTPWLYTNAIEAQGERGSGSVLVTLGADGTYGSNDEIHFVTSGNSQMRLISDGKLGLDKDPNTDLHIRQSQQSITNGTGGIKLETSNDPTDYWRVFHSGIYLSFNLQGSRVAYVNTNGAWTIDSDRNLKKGIKPMISVLDRVGRLEPVSYQYKDQSDSAERSLGFIAQDVQKLFPELVVKGEDGHLGMTYAQTGVIALKAIQEQQAEIDQYKDRIETLEQELAEIKLLLLELKK